MILKIIEFLLLLLLLLWRPHQRYVVLCRAWSWNVTSYFKKATKIAFVEIHRSNQGLEFHKSCKPADEFDKPKNK